MVYIGLAITYSGTRGRVPSGGAAAAGHHPSMPVRGPTRLCSTSREPAADSNCMAGPRPALTAHPASARPPPPPRAGRPRGGPRLLPRPPGPPPARQGGQGAALSSSVGTTRRRQPDCTAATRTPGVGVCGRGSRLLSHVSATCAHRIGTTGHTSSAEPDPARPRLGNDQRVPHQPLRVWRSTRQHEHRRRARRYVL